MYWAFLDTRELHHLMSLSDLFGFPLYSHTHHYHTSHRCWNYLVSVILSFVKFYNHTTLQNQIFYSCVFTWYDVLKTHSHVWVFFVHFFKFLSCIPLYRCNFVSLFTKEIVGFSIMFSWIQLLLQTSEDKDLRLWPLKISLFSLCFLTEGPCPALGEYVRKGLGPILFTQKIQYLK